MAEDSSSIEVEIKSECFGESASWPGFHVMLASIFVTAKEPLVLGLPWVANASEDTYRSHREQRGHSENLSPLMEGQSLAESWGGLDAKQFQTGEPVAINLAMGGFLPSGFADDEYPPMCYTLCLYGKAGQDADIREGCNLYRETREVLHSQRKINCPYMPIVWA